MNRWARRSQVLFVLVLLSQAALAQDAFLTRWNSVHASQPESIVFLISAVKTEFYTGERIPIQVSYSSSQANAFTANTRLYDRVGRLNGVEEFLVDPASLTEDPLRGLPGENMAMGGLSGGDIALSAKPFSFEKLLNEWVRFRKPGQYRVALLSRRIAPARDPAIPPSRMPLELVSNILTLTIAPAPEAWVRTQISEAVQILDTTSLIDEAARQRRLQAEQALRFLESSDSAVAMANRLGSAPNWESWPLHMGVLGSPYRKQLLPLLESRLIAPEQPVSGQFLNTLASLAELTASNGPMDPFPADKKLQAAWQDEAQRRQTLRAARRKDYEARLVLSLASKQPEARAVSMTTLLDSTGRAGATPSWLPTMVGLLVADFRKLPAKTQSNLLEARWSTIKTPAMLPVLREIYAHPPGPRVDPPLQDTAARRIYDLAPDEGRRLILSQIAAPDTYLTIGTLRMLPHRTLPEMNDILAARLEARQNPDLLILRYATGEVVQRVEKAYLNRNEELDRQKLPHCGGPLVFYFLRYDPAFGERELRREIDQPAPYPACYDIGFQFHGLDRNAYSPALERLAIEFLGSSKVPVKRGAAEVLGKYGSPAAQKPLWGTLEYFHSWWKGRENMLATPEGQEGVQFERALRISLAQADSWTLQEEGLNRLLSLCSSSWCRQDVSGWRSQAALPVAIRISGGQDGSFRVGIAEYETESVDQLRRRVVKFPAGTDFRVIPASMVDPETLKQVEQVVRSSGHSLIP